MATKPNPFKKMPPMKKKSASKDPDMAGEMARCMKQKDMTPAKCKKMMGGKGGM